jgi:flagellar biosynthetic protein FlhB
MAEQDTSQERSEEPSEKRLRESRDKGEVARSRELNTVVMLLVATIAMALMGGSVGSDILTLMRTDFTIDRATLLSEATPVLYLTRNLLAALDALAPVFVLMVVGSIVGPLLMGGTGFTLKGLEPKLSKLNPLSGLKRMFGLNALIELVKAMAKFLLLALVAWWLFDSLAARYLQLGQQPVETAIISGAWLMVLVFGTLSAALIVVVLIDVPYQKWDHKRKQRMTKQEVKEEAKETNGNPEVRGKIRRLQQEAANREMLVSVKTSDVIIVNPTHYSVALKYNKSSAGAPTVVASGIDHMALRIREIARAHEVPVYRAPLLARLLYRKVQPGEEVPTELYVAVAQVLAYIFQLQEYRSSGGSMPVRPEALSIPANLSDDG